jgi:hypothetical protein
MFECIGWAHALDFIFDEQGEDSDDLQSAFSLLIRKLPEEITKFFGNRPIHVSDMDYPPLQAADILAWSIRRMVFKMSQGEKPESFLQNLFNGISIRKRHWSNAQLQSLYDGGKQITSSQGRVYPHEANIIAENRDVLVSEINLNALRNAKPKEPVRLLPLQAKGMKRFLLVNKCQSSGSPHLHRRVGNKCLLQSG